MGARKGRDGRERTCKRAFACIEDWQKSEHGLIKKGRLFTQRSMSRKAIVSGCLLEARTHRKGFGRRMTERVDQIADGVWGWGEDHVVLDVDETQNAEDFGDLLLAHGVAAITGVGAWAAITAVASISSGVVAVSAGDARRIGVGIELFSGLFFDEADGGDAIDLVALIRSRFEFEGKDASDRRKEFVDPRLVLEFEDLDPRGPEGAFGVVEKDGEILSEGAKRLFDGTVEESAFDTDDVLHEVGVEGRCELFERGFEIMPDRSERDMGLDGGESACGSVVGKRAVDGGERKEARKAAQFGGVEREMEAADEVGTFGL